ncbi:hypothetical protein BDL97_05G074400 [Sphagnum fallax]|nr:hypothetical protein BDL97_05G074400 [Sphagnum fallax]
MLERNRPRIYTVRRGCSSLKDNQREELRRVETQQAEEDGGRESDGAELLLEEREEVQQQGKYTSVNRRDLELPPATTDAIASGLRQTEQAHAKDREEEDDEDMSGAVTAPPSLLLCCCLALSVYLMQSDFSTGSRLTKSSLNSQIFLKDMDRQICAFCAWLCWPGVSFQNPCVSVIILQ